MQKLSVCHKLHKETVDRLDACKKSTGYSKSVIIEDAITRRLDELEGNGWQHPTCRSCGHHKSGMCDNIDSPCYRIATQTTFYCSIWGG